MNERRERQISGATGVLLLLVAAGAGASLGRGLLGAPILGTQVVALGLAGTFDLLGATDTATTENWAWYRWAGLGNVCLGLGIPLGVVGTGAEPLLVAVVALGGVTIAAIGFDMILFHGKHTRGERLDLAAESL